MDTTFATSCGIHFTDTKVNARSAGSVRMQIRGQTDEEVLVDILAANFTSTISLGVCVIIDNLGTDVLIGQPAKVNHEIETKPHMGTVQFKDLNGCTRTCSMEERHKKTTVQNPAEVLRVEEDSLVYPGESLKCNLQTTLQQGKRVFITPRQIWFEQGGVPVVARISKYGSVALTNTSQNIWNLKKHSHIADCRQALSHEEALINKLYTVDKAELESFKPRQLQTTKLDFAEDGYSY